MRKILLLPLLFVLTSCDWFDDFRIDLLTKTAEEITEGSSAHVLCFEGDKVVVNSKSLGPVLKSPDGLSYYFFTQLGPDDAKFFREVPRNKCYITYSVKTENILEDLEKIINNMRN